MDNVSIAQYGIVLALIFSNIMLYFFSRDNNRITDKYISVNKLVHVSEATIAQLEHKIRNLIAENLKQAGEIKSLKNAAEERELRIDVILSERDAAVQDALTLGELNETLKRKVAAAKDLHNKQSNEIADQDLQLAAALKEIEALNASLLSSGDGAKAWMDISKAADLRIIDLKVTIDQYQQDIELRDDAASVLFTQLQTKDRPSKGHILNAIASYQATVTDEQS